MKKKSELFPETPHSLQTVNPARSSRHWNVKNKLEIFLQRKRRHDLMSQALLLVHLVSVDDGAEEDEERDDPEDGDYNVILRPPFS